MTIEGNFDTIHTATQLASALDLDETVVGHTDTTIILSNAQARRLLAMVYGGADNAWLAAPEVDGVEILGALAIASQVHAIVGDQVMAAHFNGLHGKYSPSR